MRRWRRRDRGENLLNSQPLNFFTPRPRAAQSLNVLKMNFRSFMSHQLVFGSTGKAEKRIEPPALSKELGRCEARPRRDHDLTFLHRLRRPPLPPHRDHQQPIVCHGRSSQSRAPPVIGVRRVKIVPSLRERASNSSFFFSTSSLRLRGFSTLDISYLHAPTSSKPSPP